MKCKSCGAEMEEGMNFCPKCGVDNRAAPEVEVKENKLTPGKIALLVILAVLAVAVVVGLVAGGITGGNSEDETTGETIETTEATVPADGDPDDVTCKGTYTVTDDELAAGLDTVVATMGDSALTNAQLQVYYWMEFYNFMEYYSSYAAWMGLDYTSPLDTQMSLDESLTWQQYFLESAIGSWQCYEALCIKAKQAGFELPAEYQESLDNLRADMEASAVEAGYESADAMIQADMGVNVTLADYADYLEQYYLGYLYYADVISSTKVTDAEVEAYFDENAETYAANGLEKDDSVYVDVRHILIMPQGGTTDDDGYTTYSDDEWETCRQTAQDILDQWLAGAADEASFAQLANEKSEDGGSNTNGGLYENVYEGKMVDEFNDWCFDASREYGDYDLIKTSYGYHIMFYVDSVPVWYSTAYEDLLTELSTGMLESALEEYPMEVDYSAIALGYVDVGAKMTVTE